MHAYIHTYIHTYKCVSTCARCMASFSILVLSSSAFAALSSRVLISCSRRAACASSSRRMRSAFMNQRGCVYLLYMCVFVCVVACVSVCVLVCVLVCVCFSVCVCILVCDFGEAHSESIGIALGKMCSMKFFPTRGKDAAPHLLRSS